MEVAVAEWLCGGPSKSAYAGSIPARDSHRSGSVVEMVDAPDQESGDLPGSCGFESHHSHQHSLARMGRFALYTTNECLA